MKVTQVEPQKTLRLRSGPKRFNVYLDGQFAFGADEDLVVEKRLVVGKEINKEDLEKILFEAEVGKWMGRLYRLFNIRLRSEKEIRDYIRIKNYESRIKEKEELSDLGIESLINKLKQKELINDQVFAKAWMESRRNSKKKGINVIKAELFQKGISREIIEEVVSSQSSVVSEKDLAKEALEKKLRVWKNLEPQEFKKKAIEFLIRRGFNYEIARDVVNNFLLEN